MLTSAPPFPEGARRDSAAVRRYRAELASGERESFGIDLGRPVKVDLIGRVVRSVGPRGELLTFAPAGRRGAVQVVRGPEAHRLAREWWGPAGGIKGPMRLGRAAYTQLTEGGPLPPAQTAPRKGTGAPDSGTGRFHFIDDRALGAFAAVAVEDAPDGAGVGIAVGPERDAVIPEARDLARSAPVLVQQELGRAAAMTDDAQRVIERAVRYALDCAACELGDGSTAILADHEILPLVWTRDGYYVARALLALATGDERARHVVNGFIRWLFERAELVGGAWPRSSLASGQAKDPAFQLDQQLYPALLLADHARLTGEGELFGRYADDALLALDGVLGRATAEGLVATAETPADDPLAQPFHFSSHVLLWRTCVAYGREADALQRAVREHFTHEGRFAYAVGGPHARDARHYHDANDLPLVFAPGWGFCSTDDTVWRATLAFAWSRENAGYFAGPYGGLGSLHTPHPWPLGDLQEVIAARVCGDAGRERNALERLGGVETWDAMLPEAYHETDGSVASRHWFAWPTLVRALLLADPGFVAP